jgi:enediyne biosynthesis protein E4
MTAALLLALMAAPVAVQFRDVAAEAGVRVMLENHPTPEKHMIETMAGGVAAFDFDGDGLIDIFFTNGAEIPSLRKTSPKYWNRLYRNKGGWTFEDVTEKAGLGGEGYSMGAAAADYDNDGHIDLFVAGVHRNHLYRNRGDGTFEDITERAGLSAKGWWSVAAGWFDFDNDGHPDLWVVNYAGWTPAFDRYCGDQGRNLRIYCHPKYFEGQPDLLYRNRGDGTFENVSKSSGVAAHPGRGMGVSFADYDGDGLTDVFVTNDNEPNFLFRNLGGGKFEETALLAGAALLDHGKPVASMGTDFRDYNNDGLPDIHVTALAFETYPLFRNVGGGLFRDATYTSRMGPLSVNRAGWGNCIADFNNNGWKDVFTANSHVNDLVEKFESTMYRQPNSLFLNTGDGKFADGSEAAGFGKSLRAHRGSACADFDNDGRLDVVVSALGEPAELWRNETSGAGNWLLLKLRGTKSNRDGIGAKVRVVDQHNHMTTSVGYASSSHAGVHFGLSELEVVPEVEILWPSGTKQVLRKVEANRMVEVVEPEAR